ncbi:MAG: monofunctional biosynthetic peptidoglycan transglycosylase [Gemmatimonadetes bacterium]|nr:monofunctional biosynthetic peptidoglycan transglycosylase [Gemmatimonadota bacterium]
MSRVITIVSLLLVLPAGLFAWQWFSLPDIGSLATENPRSTAFIDLYREANGQDVALQWQWVPYDDISIELKRAVVVAEDKYFFSHGGFSFLDIRKSIAEALRERKTVRGASTLSQQLSKNLWLSPAGTLTRKAREAVMTIRLERELTKRRILEIYLNVAEFAPGVYGAEAAARNRFHCSAAEINAEQGAALAACLPNPAHSLPENAGEAYRERFEKILHRASNAEWLDREL